MLAQRKSQALEEIIPFHYKLFPLLHQFQPEVLRVFHSNRHLYLTEYIILHFLG